MEKFLKKIIQEAGNIGLKYYQSDFDVNTKSHKNDLLTEADKEIGKFLVERINNEYPEHKILSEEMEEVINPKSKKEWVVDPIDDSFNFANGMHIWAVMIAYLENGKVQLSGIYFPVMNELYFAKKDCGAYLNGKKISVSSNNELKRCIGKLYFAPEENDTYGEHVARYKQAVSDMVLNSSLEFINFGASAPAACYLAKGSIDFMINNVGLDWDYLPTLFIAKEAGAKVTNSNGKEWQRGQQDIIVANPSLHPKLLQFFEPEAN